jgi:hypothetical protein
LFIRVLSSASRVSLSRSVTVNILVSS